MRLNLIGVLFILFFGRPFFSWANTTYTISDLEVLANDKNYEEFIKHARDIRPSKRDKHWSNMLHQMVDGLIDFKIRRKIFDKKSFDLFEKIALWPGLRDDAFFLNKREKYAFFYFDNCLHDSRNKKICRSAIEKFWFNSRKSPEVGYKIAKLISTQLKEQNIWHYISSIAKSNLSGFYCHRPMVEKAIIHRLLKEVTREHTTNQIKSNINKMLHPDCKKAIFPRLKEIAKYSDSQVVQVIIYNILNSQNALAPKEIDLYLTLYLLKGPMVGEVFNNAWNRIKQLSQDYERRASLIDELKQILPLPGQVFSLSDLKKRNAMTKFIAKNIPEYIELYTSTCLEYYEGRKTFPYGNPTIECRDLFKTMKKSKIIRQDLKLRFSSIKRPQK